MKGQAESSPPRRTKPRRAGASPSAPPRWAQASTRYPLAALDLVAAVVFGLSARFLPWPDFSVFTVLAAAMALVHAARASLLLSKNRHASSALRVGAFMSLGFLSWATFELVSAAVYVSRLYGSLGDGVAAAASVVWAVIALFTLPVACWALALTGGLRPIKRGATAALAVMVVGPMGGAAYSDRLAAAEPAAPAAADEAALDAAMAEVAARTHRNADPNAQMTLFTREAADCAAPIDATRLSALVAYVPASSGRARKKRHVGVLGCVQADSAPALAAAISALVTEESAGGRVKIDVILGRQEMPDLGPYLGIVALRPGLDGVCVGDRCLAPWQLVALDQFRRFSSVSEIQLKFGTTAADLRQAVTGESEPATFAGMTRIETRSYLIDDAGELHALTRMRHPRGGGVGQGAPELTPETVSSARDAAMEFILRVQEKDGRYGYLVDPFDGTVSYSNFSVPRQAGTTLALCEIGEPGYVKESVDRSLGMLASLVRKTGDLGAVVYPRGNKAPAALGSTALSMIAFVACRGVVGDRYDDTIVRLGRFLVAMQREDGGFFPSFDFSSSTPEPGPDPMYAQGQVVMALVLWEQAEGMASGRPGDLVAVIDRAMDHFSGPYWDTIIRDFFFLEENWHCLAARAALPHHRHDAYERFCIDYVTMKERLTFDEHSAVAPELVGAYGFGNVLPPHNTATAGYGEALAAKMEIMKARGMDIEAERASMVRTLSFLLSQQWTDLTCFACTTRRRIPGAFSEHVGSPEIRIDYVQHALSALGHGGRALGLLSPEPPR